MQIRAINFFCLVAALCISNNAEAQIAPPGESAPATDASPHRAQSIAVDDKVKLEVLDWGGSGRSMILLAGLGNTAHVFDGFAPKLSGAFHVYGITRRGFGASQGYGAAGSPEFGYSADRLGDDVLAVIDALHLDRPVLVGSGLAGEELSSVGSRHPEKVAGLIYLDAAYSYAYYDPVLGDPFFDLLEFEKKLGLAHTLLTAASSPRYKMDLAELRKELGELQNANALAEDSKTGPLVKRLLEGGQLAAFEKDLRAERGINPTLPGSRAEPAKRKQERIKLFDDLLETGIPAFEKQLKQLEERRGAGSQPGSSRSWSLPEAEAQWQPAPKNSTQKNSSQKNGARATRARADADRARQAILQGRQKYTHLRLPILAIYSLPHSDVRPEDLTSTDAVTQAQAKAFEAGVPMAKVVRIPNASSLVFLSNEGDVLREMNAFLGGLK